MRAAVHARYGPPDVVRVVDVDAPVPGGHDVLVKVHSTTVNRTDCGCRAAKPFFTRFFTGLVRPKAEVWGTEFAGEVVAAGSLVTSLNGGDRVFGFNDRRFGAHAEYMVIPDTGLIELMPEGMTFAKAAASSEGSHYALALIRAAGVRDGHDVLVYGATGAIGSAAVQLAKAAGAHVTAVCATAHMPLVERLGADRVLDYTTEDFTKDPHAYDTVIDAVGKSSFGRCRRLLKPGGIYQATDLGPFWQNPLLALITRRFGSRKVRFPIAKADRAMARTLKELVESGAFAPVIDRTYPLDDIVEAYRYVETGQKVGNVVIAVTADGAA